MRKELTKYYIVLQYQVDSLGYQINRMNRVVTKNSAIALNIYNEVKEDRKPFYNNKMTLFTQLIRKTHETDHDEIILENKLY